MDWKQLISNKRLGQEQRHTERHDDRSEFKRDYDRLIFSAPFRRLQNKTQVFPLPGSVFVHNRLTHSLEVASVGMSLGNDVSQRIIQEKRPELRGTLFEEMVILAKRPSRPSLLRDLARNCKSRYRQLSGTTSLILRVMPTLSVC